jgi:hypothetical protein
VAPTQNQAVLNWEILRNNITKRQKGRTKMSGSASTLTPGSSGNVKPNSFGVLQSVQLGVATGDTANDYVDAQPLVVNALTINGTTQDIVYVVTEANNIYAISASSGPALGKILVHRKLGTPVPRPLGCGNNGPVLGISSTPVIHLDPTDLTSGGTMYVMSNAARPCGHAKA